MAESEASGGGSARTGQCRWDPSGSGWKMVGNIKEARVLGRALGNEAL